MVKKRESQHQAFLRKPNISPLVNRKPVKQVEPKDKKETKK